MAETCEEGSPIVTADLRSFYDCLDREERDIASDLAADRLGLLMRIAINELDLDVEGLLFGASIGESDHERSYIMRLGVIRIIKLAMQMHKRFDVPTITIQRDLAYSIPVLSLIGRVGTIEHGRRVAQSLAAMSGRIAKVQENLFSITLPSRLPDLELHERELERYQDGKHRETFVERYEAVIGSKIGDDVRTLLAKLVYPFRTCFIGYDADPILDFYFFGHAYNEMLLAKGFDTFHFSTPFGGMTFGHYQLAATFIVSVGLKHRAFVRALLTKETSIRLEDILTVSVETAGFLEGMREFINEYGERFEGHVRVTDEGVLTIFDVLSVSRQNLMLLDRPGAPIPPLIQCSDDHVIRPLVGAHSNEIMLFLLTSLQHRYSRDYDRAQRSREGVMQRAVEGSLSSLLPRLVYRGNIKLKQKGRILTDLDLVVAEPSSDKVILIQLKHQDPYGADLAAMLSRTGRLNQQVSDWLQKVRSWLAASNASQLRTTLRLPISESRPVVSLLVLTRHYAHSLRRVVDGDEATYANWRQFVTAVARLEQQKTHVLTVDDLIKEIKVLSVPEVQYHLPERFSEWRVGNLRFTIVQGQDQIA